MDCTQNSIILCIVFLFLSAGGQGASDILYDFGVQEHHPKVTSTNPALLARCKPQTMAGFSSRNIAFELEDSQELSLGQDKGRSYGSVDFGMCERLLRWFSYGVHVNANALSFKFATQNRNDPVVFPYGKDALPIASGGIAIQVTEPFAAGFAWKMVERVDVEARIPVTGLELQAEIDVDVRPVISWLLGGSYEIFGQEFYYSYSPEIRGNLDFAFDVDINLPFVSYDLGLVELQTAISFVPAQNRVGVLGSFAGFDYDLGLVQSQWSKFDDPFLNVETFGNLDVVLFPARAPNLQDTYDPYVVVRRQMGQDLTVQAGYAYRRNPIKAVPSNEPLVGADLHSVKLGFEKSMKLINRPIVFGGDLVVGFMNGSQATSSTQQLQGYFTNIQGFVRLPLD